MMGFYNTRWKGADEHLSEMWKKFEGACGRVTPANLGLPKQLWLYDPWSGLFACLIFYILIFYFDFDFVTFIHPFISHSLA